jgi:predicted enzyme related to lactoylglutathione lyase
MGNPVVHFEIGGSDRAALQGFYNHLFDWKIESNDSMEYSFVSPGGEGSIGGGICGAPSERR